jgi:hypothetical protein
VRLHDPAGAEAPGTILVHDPDADAVLASVRWPARLVDNRSRHAGKFGRRFIQKEATVRKLSSATVLALFGLVPALGIACEYEADNSASATPPAQLASVAPAATKAPAASVLKAPAPKATPKQVSAKSKEPAGNAKVAVLSAD